MYFFNLYLAILLASFSTAMTTDGDSSDIVTEPFDIHLRPSSMDEQTVSKLMNEQTETIKKIISAHKPGIETPILLGKESIPSNVADHEEPIIKEEEGPFEDVRAKCEYYFKISNSRLKDAEKREENLKPANIQYVYASNYGNQPVYADNHYPSTLNVEPTVSVANLGVVKEENEQKRYYQYVPYNLNNKQSNINVDNLPYFYASTYGSQTVPLATHQVQTQAPNQFNSNSNLDPSISVGKLGIIKEESAQNKYYEYAPNNVQTKTSNFNVAHVQHLHPLGYTNQPLSFPVYAENQVSTKSTIDSPTVVKEGTTWDTMGQIDQNIHYQYIPYNFYSYPTQNLPTIQQKYELNKHSSLNNVQHQVTQISSQHDVSSDQKYINQNQDVNYVKVAPLSLQNALVSDGRTLYYWYKSMPGYQIYVNVPYNMNNSPKLEEPLPQSSQIHNYQSKINYAYITHPPKTIESTTPIPTTTTTTTTELVPTYEVKYATKDNSKDVLKHQLKFVYPVPYSDTVNKNPWQIDPYAYYPKDLRPNLMNVRLPYAPTFHVIKTLDIPNGKAKVDNITKK